MNKIVTELAQAFLAAAAIGAPFAIYFLQMKP